MIELETLREMDFDSEREYDKIYSRNVCIEINKTKKITNQT